MLGKAAGADLDLFDRLVQRHAAFEMPDDLGVAQGLSGLPTEARRLRQQTPNFIHQTPCDHALDAHVYASGILVLVAPDPHDRRRISQRLRRPLLLLLAQRTPGRVPDLQRPLDPL